MNSILFRVIFCVVFLGGLLDARAQAGDSLAKVEIISAGSATGISNGTVNGPSVMEPGAEYEVGLPEDLTLSGTVSVFLSCDSKSDWLLYSRTVFIERDEYDEEINRYKGGWKLESTGATFSQNGSSPIPTNPDPEPDPGDPNDGLPVYQSRAYEVKVEYAGDSEESGDGDGDGDGDGGGGGGGGGGSPVIPKGRPIFDSASCCGSALGTYPDWKLISAPDHPSNYISTATPKSRYRIPLGGLMRTGADAGISNGAWEFLASPSLNLATSWHTCLKLETNHAVPGKLVPTTASGRWYVSIGNFTFDARYIGGAVVIRQYSNVDSADVLNENFAGLTPLRTYKIRKTTVLNEDCLEFARHEGNNSEPEWVDSYFSGSGPGGTMERWEYSEEGKIESITKSVATETPTQANGYVKYRITTVRENLEMRSGLAYPESQVETTHVIATSDGGATNYIGLESVTYGSGPSAATTRYAYDEKTDDTLFPPNSNWVVATRYKHNADGSLYAVDSELTVKNQAWFSSKIWPGESGNSSARSWLNGHAGDYNAPRLVTRGSSDPQATYYFPGGNSNYWLNPGSNDLRLLETNKKYDAQTRYVLNTNGVNTPYFRKYTSKKAVLGRSGSASDKSLWRQGILDYLAISANGNFRDAISTDPQDISTGVPGELFRSIQSTGNTTEYTHESQFTPGSGQTASYPAADGPYMQRFEARALLTAVTGLNVENAGYTALPQPFKSTRTRTVSGKKGIASMTEQVWDGTEWLDMSVRHYSYNAEGKLQTVTQDGAVVESYSYPNDTTVISTDSQGVVTTQVSDADGSVVSSTKQGAAATSSWAQQPDIVTSYNETYVASQTEANRVGSILRTETTSAGGLSRTSSSRSHVGGARLESTDERGVVTAYSASGSGGFSSNTQSRANAAWTATNTRYLDGQQAEVSGTGRVKKTYTYEVKASEGIEETETVWDGATAVAVNKRLRTGDGELIKETLDGVITTYAYDGHGRVVSKTTGAKVYRYEYDYRDLVVREGYDVDGNGSLTAGSGDVMVERDQFYETDNGEWWLVNTQTTYVEAGNATLKRTTTQREKQGTGAGSVSQTIRADGTVETVTRSVSGKVVTTTVVSTAYPGRTATTVVYNGLMVSSQTLEQAHPVIYQHDAFGREVRSHDLGTNQIRLTSYDPVSGEVNLVKSGSGELMKYGYYPATDPNAGRLHWTENGVGERTYYAYNLLGQPTHQWGSGSQPLRSTYDAAGRMLYLDTFKATSAWVGDSLPAAFASAAYDRRSFAHEGTRLGGRSYGFGAGEVEYEYNADGSLHQRIWPGAGYGGTTTYGYTSLGQVSSIAYSDATPGVAATYDRRGQLESLTDAAGTHTYVRQADGSVEETVTNGVLAGLALKKTLNSAGRVTGLEWSFAGFSHKASYVFDSQMRMESVSLAPVGGSSLVSASYGYHPDTGRLQTLTRPIAGGSPLVGTFVPDVEGRPDTMLWKRGSYAYGGHDYKLNAKGLRTEETRLDGTKLIYDYTSRGELKEVKRRRTADNSLRPDWTHGYTYDDSGTRLTTLTPEGESLSHGLVTVSGGSGSDTAYTSTGETKQWIRGRANPRALVEVNGQTVEREGELWRYLVTKSSAEATPQVDVQGSRPEQTTPEDLSYHLPRSATAYRFDPRGNLVEDEMWIYTWDQENRLVMQEQKYPYSADLGEQVVRRIQCRYDAFGHRISKGVFTNEREFSGNLIHQSWTLEKETVFIWQDWTLLAELVKTSPSGSYALRRSYLWGLDVDGTFGGAGGVGGLLWVADYVPGISGSNRQLAPWYDGNGNVMGWVENEGAQMLPVHRLEYDPFGRLLVEDDVRVSHTKKQRDLGVQVEWLDRPAFGFSTKYEDVETRMLYYGYRYYSPEVGRWLSRDPIEEEGGINLYGMVGNDPVNKWDYLGWAVLTGVVSKWQDFHGNIVWGSDEQKVTVRGVRELKMEIESRGHCDCIKALHVMGHGSRQVITLGQQDLLEVERYSGNAYKLKGTDLTNYERVDLTELLNFCEDGQLVLDGCNTAREFPWDTENIARDASKAFPGVPVVGNRGYAFAMIPLSENVYGFTRCYLNGENSDPKPKSPPTPVPPMIPLGY